MGIKKDQGFTLIEIIVTLAVTAIVGIFLASYLTPQIQMFHGNSQQSTARSACFAILNEMQERLVSANDISLSQGRVTYTLCNENSDHTEQTIDLTTIGQQVFPALTKSYRRESDQLSAAVAVERKQQALYEIRVTIKNSYNETIYTQSQWLRCRNEET